MARRRFEWLGAAAVVLAAGATAAAEMPRGVPVEKVVCQHDPARSYALFLPEAYDPEKPAPILYLLDARGRAMHALERFVAAADEWGWILASSHDSRSDGPVAPNIDAMRAMWTDTHARFAIDDRRVYLTGFSGGARASVMLAEAAPGTIAGVIAVGAGFPPDMPPDDGIDYAIYGLVGETDFNFDELQALDVTLDGVGARHRIEVFEGSHQWAPEEHCAAALAWMELVAMAEGRRERDPAAVDALYAEDLESARRLEESGRIWEAWHRYAAAASTFAPLREVAEARAASERLAASKPFEAASRERERRAAWEAEAIDRARRALGSVAPGEERRSLGRVLSRFDLKGLEKRAKSEDRQERLAAQRALESIFVQSAFYVPRDLLDSGQYERALLVLRVAEKMRPEDPRVWWGLARAHARLGEKDDALRWLERLVDGGVVGAATLRQDPHLAPLRGDERFESLLSRLGG